MSQIQKRFIANNAVDGEKLLLTLNQSLRMTDTGGEVNVLAFDGSDNLVISSAPFVGDALVAANQLVTKGDVDATFIRIDGTVAFTGAQSMGGQDLTNAAGVYATDLYVGASELQISESAGDLSFNSNSLVGVDSLTLNSMVFGASSFIISEIGGEINVGGAVLTGLGAPSNPTDAATVQYVDDLVQGLSWKQAVHAASAVGEDVGLSGVTPLVVDGHTLEDQQRVLLKNQTDSTENGIYVVTITGGNYTLARASDDNTSAEMIGAVVYVQQGDTNAGTKWVCTVPPSYQIGIDPCPWALFSDTGNVNGTGSNGQVAYWTGASTLAGEDYLSAARGGLGTDASAFTGVVKAASGVFSASEIINSDISATAAIDFTKMAAFLNGDRAIVSDASGFLVESSVTATEVGYLSGVTSGIQGQLDGLDGRITDIENEYVVSVNGASGVVTVDAINELTGDVTAGPASGSQSAVATIANNAITTAKIAADAVTGAKIRLDYQEWLRSRNSTNTGDVNMIRVTGANVIEIGASVIPSANLTQTLGSDSLAFSRVIAGTHQGGAFRSGNATGASNSAATNFTSGTVETGTSGQVFLGSGAASQAGGNSGNILIASGTVVSGTRGTVTLAGSDVILQNNAAGGLYANSSVAIQIHNVDAPSSDTDAVNRGYLQALDVNLVPASDMGIDLGSLSNFVAAGYIQTVVAGFVNSKSGSDLVLSSDSNVYLNNDVGGVYVSSAPKILGNVDTPVSDNDAANKKFVDDAIAALPAAAQWAREDFTLSSGDITAKLVALANSPIAESVILWVQGAGAQLYGYDYTLANGNEISWNALGLDGVLAAGDVIQVQYQY